MRYSIEPIDRIFVKGYGFLSFARNIDNNNGKNKSVTYTEDIVKIFLIRLNNPPQMHLKLLHKSNSKHSKSEW